MFETSTLLTIAVATLLSVSTVIPRFLKFRAAERKARLKHQRTDGTELNVAVSLHPRIDVVQCIGCGSCVRACPEGDVLGLINGKATLIHASKCVGHGLCAEECPVGAIQLVMGSPGRGAELPHLDGNLQTNIPGLYIAGELGGLGLIKNAIQQGVRVVDHIVSARNGSNGVPLDIVIVGAGPAGLAAGLNAKRHGLKYAVLEQGDIGGTVLQYPRRKIVMTAPVELPLYGRLRLNETSKESLLEKWMHIISRTGVQIQTNERVTDIRKNDAAFMVATSRSSYQAKSVVLAVGRRGTPRKLGVPGEQLSKVCYRLIETESYQNMDLLVVGGGDSSVEAAYALASQGTNRVTLSYRREEFTRIKERNTKHLIEAEKRMGLKVILQSEVREIREQEVCLQTKDGPITIPNDAVFIFAGGELPYDFLRKIGIAFASQSLS